jgi:Leucine-rich repeat (LRR) protein
MPAPQPVADAQAPVRHIRTQLSPLETADDPVWLHQATAVQRRRLGELQHRGRQARQAAMVCFARYATLYTYAKQLDTFAIRDVQDVTPADLQEHSNADLKTYLEYLQPLLRLASLRSLKLDAYEATLREEQLLAEIKGHLDSAVSSTLSLELARFAQGKNLGSPSPINLSYRPPVMSLTLSGNVLLSEIILFDRSQNGRGHCIVFVPGHPHHPLMKYQNPQHFLASLQRELEEPTFQAFFERFIPLRHRAAARAAFQEAARTFSSPALGTIAMTTAWHDWVLDKMTERLTDDARFLVQATQPGTLFATDPLHDFSSLIQSHLMLGAGVGISAGEEDEGRSPSDSVEPLRWVRLPNGCLERWRVDLSRYRLADPADAGPVDAQGIYQIDGNQAIRINQHFYPIAWDPALGKWRIESATVDDIYCPILEHNRHGAWHHSLEQPQYWSRLSLLRRLGPIVEGFSDQQLLDFACISNTSNAQLRRVYSCDEPAPAMLRETLMRARLQAAVSRDLQRIAAGETLADEADIPQLRTFRQLVDIRLGLRPGGNRPRRSPGDTPPPGQCPADQTCDAPPADLFSMWFSRLSGALFTYRYELAHIHPDLALVELRRQFPDIPVSLAQLLLDRVRPNLIAELQVQNRVVPPSLTRDFNQVQEDLPLTRALEGFLQPALANRDTFRLAVGLLEFLPGWPTGTALVLRDGHLGPVLASVGNIGVDTNSLYQDDDENWIASSATQVPHNQDASPLGFYRSLLQALGASVGTSLGLGLNEPERLHQQLTELAMARPLRARLLLGLPGHHPWLAPTPLDPWQRNAPLGGGPGLFEREPVTTRIQALHSNLGILRLDHFSINLLLHDLLRREEPILPWVQAREREHAQLQDLQAWVDSSPNEAIREARADAVLRIRYAWEAQFNLVTVTLDLRDPALDVLPPNPVPLPAVESLTITDVPITAISESFIQHLPNLHRIAIHGAPLTALPQALGDLQFLQNLDLSRTRVAPPALSMLSRARRLQHLYLNDMDRDDMHWTVADMTAVSASPALSALIMERSQATFDDGVFAVLSRASNLWTLQLTENELRLDAGEVAALGRLSALRVLDLSGNHLSATPDFSQMPHLEELNLRNTGLTQWPAGLDQLHHLAIVNLRNLYFDTVPPGAGSNAALVISPESVPEADRARFRLELEAAGGEYLPSDYSSEFNSSSDAELLDPGHHLRPWTTLLFVGLSEDEREQADSLSELPAAENFFAVLRRIHSHYRTRLNDIQTLIRAAFDEPTRTALFQIVDDVTCIDRDALMFSQMLHLAEAARLISTTPEDATPMEMLGLALSLWRWMRLHEHVSGNMSAWRSQGHDVSDPVEVQLYFLRHLAPRLGIRHAPSEQAYSAYTRWVTDAMLDQAATAVQSTQASLFPGYLASEVFWQRYLKFAYAREMAAIDAWRGQLGGYLDSLAAGEELPAELSGFERQQLGQVLAVVLGVPQAQAITPGLTLSSDQYIRAYKELEVLVKKAWLELSMPLLEAYLRQENEPQPGPSWRN